VLIGKTTFIEPRQNIRIVDWRHAPISQLYYRYDEGAQYEESFGDREVEGEVLLRRTVTIADGELRRVSAPQGTYVRTPDGWRCIKNEQSELAGGEGSAVRAEHMKGVIGGVGELDQREDRHLPEIAALLDGRQFELISSPDTGLVIIQGGAGSGKTTIGVHRMAYLSFQSRNRFAAHRMLVVVGTPALRDYIGQLLAALDLSHVKIVTFSKWASRMRQNAFPWLRPPLEDNTPIEVSRYKTDPAILKLLEKRAEEMRRKGRTGVQDALWLWADVLTDKKAVEAAFAETNSGRLTAAQIERAHRWCSDRCPAIVEWTKPDRDYNDREIAGADGVVEQDDERATLDEEDNALLLRAFQLVRGPLRKKNKALRYQHLFVDEAQDLAPVDLCVLTDIVNDQKSITLAGDTSQRLNVDTGFTEWQQVIDALGPSVHSARSKDHVAIEPLRIAYRSTKEVLRFARDVLGPLADPDEPVAPRSGAPVELHQLPSNGAAAGFLADALRHLSLREPRATVAVLARYPEQADAYYDVLKRADVPHVRRISDYDFAFRPGVEITEVRQVKGLEYDYVILVDVNASSYPDTDEARYQLHIGATRAAHQLWVVTSGKLSPLVPEWLLDS
jgi:DNA helicase-2/ATP-dependent DNA helicase PcrA